MAPVSAWLQLPLSRTHLGADCVYVAVSFCFCAYWRVGTELKVSSPYAYLCKCNIKHVELSWPARCCTIRRGFICVSQGWSLRPRSQNGTWIMSEMRRAETFAPFWNLTLYFDHVSFWQCFPSRVPTGSFDIHWPVKALIQVAECQGWCLMS